MASGCHDRFLSCFKDWITLQHEDLKELDDNFTMNPTETNRLESVIQRVIQHFEDYASTRSELAQKDAPSFLSPTWCTSFENACLWIGGCRPSLSFRIIYSLCGAEIEAQLVDFFQGQKKGTICDISSKQLVLIDGLHTKTVKEEDKLTSKLATLQENISDHPLVTLANKFETLGEASLAVDRSMGDHSAALASLLVQADNLRLNTLKELSDILSPLQTVELLLASKKLHLSMHQWGKCRDLHIGRKS